MFFLKKPEKKFSKVRRNDWSSGYPRYELFAFFVPQCVQVRLECSVSGSHLPRQKSESRSLGNNIKRNRDIEAYRQHHRKDGCEVLGCNENERIGGLEKRLDLMAESSAEGRKQHEHAKSTDTIVHISGVVAATWY